MKRKMLSCVLALALVLAGSITVFADGAAPAAPAGDAAVAVPVDVAGGQYETAVKALVEKGIVKGYEDGTYRPANTIDRAEACTMVVKMLAPTEEQLTAAKASSFTDMNGDYTWAQKYVDYAVEKGVVKGYANNVFKPGNQVTYEEMATMVVNALGFTDKDLTGIWPENYVNKAKELGVFNAVDAAKVGEIAANRGDVALMIFGGIDPTAKDYAKTLLSGSTEKSGDVKSMSVTMTMDMKMSAAGESVDTKTVGDIDYTYDPIAMKMIMNTSMLGQNVKMEAYLVKEDSQFMMYMNDGASWTKTPLAGLEEIAEMNSNPANMELYLKSVGTLRVEGRDTVNGKPAVKLLCNVSADYMNEILESTGALSAASLKDAGLDEAALKNIYKDMSFSYYLWIDQASGLPVKYDMDLTEMMQKVMKNMEETTKDQQTAAVTVDKMAVAMTVTGYDNVAAIAVPEAAKSAPVVTPGAVTAPEQ